MVQLFHIGRKPASAEKRIKKKRPVIPAFYFALCVSSFAFFYADAAGCAGNAESCSFTLAF